LTEQAFGMPVVFRRRMNRDRRVVEVMALMERHRREPLSVEELARAVSLSPSYLTRLFHRETGRSPARYDRDCRLDAAQALLRTTPLSVKEVMASVGWTDPSHFCREFKRRFGVSPRAARVTVGD
jgi:transcriptional regulator GlxA family with amidase domain